MFTGLIEDVATLTDRQLLGKAGKLTVTTHLPLADIRIGDSLAVNGVCLTVEALQPQARSVVFHTLQETLQRTNLGGVSAGGAVNLERALRFGDRLGGHLVTGHVDATAKVRSVARAGDDWVFTVELAKELQPYVVMKGSIAVDGISLTVAGLTADSFSVHVIPHTLAATNLAHVAAGTQVNLETDLIGKYLVRQAELREPRSGVTPDYLREHGFEV